MGDPGQKTFIQLVAVLLVTGALRAAWHQRGTAATSLPGVAVAVEALADSAARLAEAEARRTRPLAEGEKLDPNRAPEEELDRLPGVGPATARAVVEARETLPFQNLDDLTRVRGIGERTVQRLQGLLALESVPIRPPGGGIGAGVNGEPRRGPTGGPSPTRTGTTFPGAVNVNRATATEMQAIPGIGPVLARRIVEYRSRYGAFRTSADLRAVSGIGPVLLERLLPHIRFR
jgi:competence ComEA-like helix-hairpin-helix protein